MSRLGTDEQLLVKSTLGGRLYLCSSKALPWEKQKNRSSLSTGHTENVPRAHKRMGAPDLSLHFLKLYLKHSLE